MKVLKPIQVEDLKLIVFDLDGTLIDSREDLFQSVNAMLARWHRPSLPLDVIASYIGDGAPMLVRRALGDPEDEAFVQTALQYFLEYYSEHKLDFTYVYEGVVLSLERFRDEWPTGLAPAMAVLTNKPVNASRAICGALQLSPFFCQIYGGNSFPTKKPEPTGLLTLMRECGALPHETLMIGDSSVDVLTARNAEAFAMGCTFGLAPESLHAAPPDILVDSPWEWPAALGIPTGT